MNTRNLLSCLGILFFIAVVTPAAAETTALFTQTGTTVFTSATMESSHLVKPKKKAKAKKKKKAHCEAY
jgi:hypothetical protein